MTSCLSKRPCRLDFSMAIGSLECNSLQLTGRGSATPRLCEKRSSPSQNFGPKIEERSPDAVSSAAEAFFGRHHQDEVCEGAEVSTKRMRRHHRGRRVVSFSGCSKSHDGLRPSSRILDALVYGYFESQSISGASDIRSLILERFGGSSYATPDVLVEVHEKLVCLCDRAQNLADFCSMPVLLHGGGRGLQLQSIHRPHLVRLAKLFKHFLAEEETADLQN
mmetsp:Transcript_1298/g.1955  ORF Transcript_1298/g.1955 Transcript_1298/m.1955 type:complete len:221 (+) Transcript_1298:416-1078(+)|eukprot:CAMPEP_0195516904 /NCGR_PEP_ID=MMETSP0794_2-20130614/9058_1 /TAXON_ID=515487 /ORGANISM="Stephanopyxis turris, Strain CCMP 815" /LENGTH=220 /DNA_ID=CAMNT_0040645617 /DNA_START=404 /DNA_END=1066 /DNA_ORIENTATION=+